MSEQQNQPGKGGKPAPAPAKRSTFHVVGPGSVQFDGKPRGPGSEIELTEEEAKSLGEAVAAGNAPPPPEEVAKRRAGKYAVRKERNVLMGGKVHGPGTVLDLDEKDARSLGDYVERAR